MTANMTWGTSPTYRVLYNVSHHGYVSHLSFNGVSEAFSVFTLDQLRSLIFYRHILRSRDSVYSHIDATCRASAISRKKKLI